MVACVIAAAVRQRHGVKEGGGDRLGKKKQKKKKKIESFILKVINLMAKKSSAAIRGLPTLA